MNKSKNKKNKNKKSQEFEIKLGESPNPAPQGFEAVSVSTPYDQIAPTPLGELLKTRRLNLKMEVSEVSSYLKIKPADIAAIEDDNFENVTKHLYVPGLIRSYARILKIDPKTIEENIRLIPIKSNTENKKHQLINIGESSEISPSKDMFFNFLLASVLLFLVLLSFYNSYEDKSELISNQSLVKELESIE